MNSKYRPLDSSVYPRFLEIKTFMRLPYDKDAKDLDFIVMGAPFDTAASYRTGSRFGPQAIRNASALVRTYSYQHKIDLFEYLSGCDAGDIPVIPGYIHESYEAIEHFLTPIVQSNTIPIVMGGDHSITLAELRALSKKHGPLNLIQFDSHTDVSDLHMGQKYTHATPFRRAIEEGLINPHHSIQIGIRGSLNTIEEITSSEELGFRVVTADEVFDLGISDLIKLIKNTVKDEPTFLTYDIDFVDPAYAPGTGTPEIGGVTSREALQILRGLTNINFVGFDLVEVLPLYDSGELTSSLAANILFEMIALIAVNKRKNKGDIK